MRHDHLTSTRPSRRRADELHGDYAASVADSEGIHAHILMMADQLSAGIIAQFPSRLH